MVTRDRVGAALAIAGGIVGLVLVFTTHKPVTDGDDQPGAAPTTSSVQTAGPQTPLPGVPTTQAPAPQAPAPPKDDDD